ncbi:HAD family hydrolase [Timonella sp. A28]|uniref:HAD family hydrolase n=1 Tax=Timonella sp. A28 TaxID=3442640 RepID=UPI003EBC5DFA
MIQNQPSPRAPHEPAQPETGSAPQAAAFFDVDNTIIRGASAFHLAKALYKQGFFRTRDIITFGLKQTKYVLFGENTRDIDTLRSRALDLMSGHSVAEVITVGEDVYDQVLAHRIYPGTKTLLDAHIAAGHQVWLVTATPIEIGALIARRLGATGALATIAEHDASGYYTGRLVGDMMHGAAKSRGVHHLAKEHNLDLEASYAYGDSTNDIALLNTVGNPCAINPDARLRRHAQEVGWPIREFRGKRRVAKRGITTASWTGLIWVVALVAKRTLAKIKR